MAITISSRVGLPEAPSTTGAMRQVAIDARRWRVRLTLLQKPHQRLDIHLVMLALADDQSHFVLRRLVGRINLLQILDSAWDCFVIRSGVVVLAGRVELAEMQGQAARSI